MSSSAARGTIWHALACGVWLAAACGASPSRTAEMPAAPAPPVPNSSNGPNSDPDGDALYGCRQAAIGLERGTRGLRPPEGRLADAAVALCDRDGWPAGAIECFARMTEGDFGRCAVLLPEKPRARLFDRVGGGSSDRVAIASSLARISGMPQVGIAECDAFVAAVAHVLVCDAMAVEVRAQLGREMADFWSLPTSGLPPDAQLRMADVCTRSQAALEREAADAGCAP